jgi:hypothetical protein
MPAAQTPSDAISRVPRLLHADEDRLRLVAAMLARGGRFVLLVADRALWPAARELLGGLLPDQTFVEHAPTSPDEASRAIDDPQRATPGRTIVLRISGRQAGPIEVLGRRRESLSRAAASFLVVLEGDEAHARFRHEAPDCYSYRDLLAVLQGEPSFEAPEPREAGVDVPRLAAEARAAAAPEERAAGLLSLARDVLQRGQARQARELLDEAIAALPEPAGEQAPEQEDARALLAELHTDRADLASHAERYRGLRRARDVLAPIAYGRAHQLAGIDGRMVDAIGIDLAAADQAVQRAREGHGGLPWQALANLTRAYVARDDLVRARAAVAEIDAFPSGHATTRPWLHFLLLVHEGAWTEADRLASPTGRERGVDRQRLDVMRATLLSRRGELGAAQRVFETLPPSVERERALARIAAERGQTRDARIQLEQRLDRPAAADGPSIDERLELHAALLHVAALELAAGGSELAPEALDARLEALRLHVERTEDPDPPWDLIRCLLLQADAYLLRSGAEPLAAARAEQAWQLADKRASVLAPGAARRLVVASLRLGELDRAQAWLARGLARAREHEHRGDEAQLAGLALWHASLAGGDVGRAEADLRAAVAATGSVLVEASVLARVGAALGRKDLLQRARQIYRSLRWPAREGACLEALGDLRIAEARYRAYGLAARLAILQGRSGPPPIAAVDDD